MSSGNFCDLNFIGEMETFNHGNHTNHKNQSSDKKACC